VLVVDDDADIRQFVAEFLVEELGTPVIEASSAEAALSLIARERPRLVLLDLSLPPLDGVACARRVRAELTDWPAAIVAMSASPERRQEALAAGCDAFLAKPFDLDALLTLVRAWLPPRA
jgi:two-component system, cell cycle response regulator DivK